jgi:hypothetical protein
MSDTPRTDALPDYMDATALRAAHAEMERMLVAVTREKDKAQALNAEWSTKAATWMASPEGVARLEGYREMGRMAADAENKCDALRAELAEANRIREETFAEAMRQGSALRAEVERLRGHITQIWDACQIASHTPASSPYLTRLWMRIGEAHGALTPAEVTK